LEDIVVELQQNILRFSNSTSSVPYPLKPEKLKSEPDVITVSI
jgi:hypothetical protein